jgi:hypothetical protein
MSEFEVVRSALRHAADNLERTLTSIQGPGSPDDLRARTALTSAHLGDWDAGQTLAITTDRVHNTVIGSYQEFLNDYQAAIAALRKVADNYDQAEDLTARKVRAVMRGTDKG